MPIPITILSDTLEQQNLQMSFYGVRDLQMHIASGPFQFQGLHITSIRECQWEHLKYKATTDEFNSIAFYCRTFDSKLIADEDNDPDLSLQPVGARPIVLNPVEHLIQLRQKSSNNAHG